MDRVKDIVEEVKNFHRQKVELSEENTKLYLILPIFEYLGWNYRSYREVRAEFVSDVRSGGAEKVDFAIMKDNEPYIFVECKPLDTDLSKYIGQLERYYSATIGVRYGILTDGNKWLFFTDYKNKNLMDKQPFYSVCLEDFKENDIEIFDIFKKENIDNIDSDLRSLLLKDIMQKIIKGEDKDFLNWCSNKLGFKVNKIDLLRQIGCEKTVINHEEKIIKDKKKIVKNKFDKPYSFVVFGQEYLFEGWSHLITTVLNELIKTDIESYQIIKNWSYSSAFFILSKNDIEGANVKSYHKTKHFLSNGDYFYYNMDSKDTKARVNKMLSYGNYGNVEYIYK